MQRGRRALKILGALALAAAAAFPAMAETSGAAKPIVVKVGTTSDEPRIWEAIEKKLVKENIKIKIVNFANGANPNQALADGDIDLNAFQHYAYLNKNKAELKLDLTAIGDTLIVPLDLFSKKAKSPAELKSGAKIALPNDVTNEGRALHVLETAGLIKLKAGAGLNPTLKDVAENPKGFQFVELPGAQIPRSLEDVDAAVINAGYAVDSGLDLTKDPIFKDKIDLTDPDRQPYINVIVARTADINNPAYKAIVRAYQSDEIAVLIRQIYKNAAIPAWDKKYAKASGDK
jgi:D-methionine transport system substrate-binding protein